MTALKILSVLVENKPGALFRVANMIRMMRLNVEGLTCAVTSGDGRSRITATVNGDDATVDFVAKQLSKVIDVFEARTYTPQEVTAAELALIRLNLPETSQCNDRRLEGARIVETSDRSMTVQVVGMPSEIDHFIQLFESTDILDIARTGITAVPKGLNK